MEIKCFFVLLIQTIYNYKRGSKVHPQLDDHFLVEFLNIIVKFPRKNIHEKKMKKRFSFILYMFIHSCCFLPKNEAILKYRLMLMTFHNPSIEFCLSKDCCEVEIEIIFILWRLMVEKLFIFNHLHVFIRT